MEFLHWLGFCPCNHGHADLTDMFPILAAVPLFFTLLLARVSRAIDYGKYIFRSKQTNEMDS